MSKTCSVSACLFLLFLAGFTFSLPAVPLGSPSLSLVQNVAMPTGRAKAEVQPLTLVQSSSNVSVPGFANASTSSLRTTDDFPIPDTPYSLLFGNLGSQLYPWDLETLLVGVSAEIEEEIVAHGRNARLPSEEYSMTLAGLQLWMWKMPWDTDNLAWAHMAIIVRGLVIYIVDGGHNREAFIDLVNHVTGRQIAFGGIRNTQRLLEPTSSTRAVESA